MKKASRHQKPSLDISTFTASTLATPEQLRLLEAVRPRSPRFARGVPRSSGEFMMNVREFGPFTSEQDLELRAYFVAETLILHHAIERMKRTTAAAIKRRHNANNTRQRVMVVLERYRAAGEPPPKQEVGCREAGVSVRTYQRVLADLHWRGK